MEHPAPWNEAVSIPGDFLESPQNQVMPSVLEGTSEVLRWLHYCWYLLPSLKIVIIWCFLNNNYFYILNFTVLLYAAQGHFFVRCMAILIWWMNEWLSLISANHMTYLFAIVIFQNFILAFQSSLYLSSHPGPILLLFKIRH